MKKSIPDIEGDEAHVFCGEHALLHKASGVYVSIFVGEGWWYGDRAQTRALIEALRQADAETRTEREVIVRKRLEGDSLDVVGLEPNDVHERFVAAGPASTIDAAKVWWKRVSETMSKAREHKDAPVTFVGFDD